jgi:flavorubredoxin
VGAVDWGVRNFHGYTTHRGTTYNAYLILDKKITLIDTVKKGFEHELIERIASVIDPRKIKIIVSNHSEMDHSGCLPEVIDMIGPEKVYASAMGEKTLSDHFHGRISGKVVPVRDGETVSLGDMKLIFAETRMLHWPDSMIAFLPDQSLLFSQDAFGMHLASFERFDDQVDDSVLDYEGGKYYANIIMPYAALVTKLLERVPATGWDIKVIAPDHGPVWRSKIPWILSRYERWASGAPSNKALVVYDTMWQSTARMARAVGEGLSAGGTDTVVLPMAGHHRSDVVTEILNAGALVVGSPTLNNGMFPTVADFLCYMKGLKPKNKLGAAFGSYGWSGEAVKMIEGELADMKIELVQPGLRTQFVPEKAILDACHEFGRKIGQAVLADPDAGARAAV